jgi:hypothetical protein
MDFPPARENPQITQMTQIWMSFAQRSISMSMR